MGIPNVLNDELDLVHTAPMANSRLFRTARQPQLGNELVNKDDKADGTDEASEERPAQHAVEESQSDQASDQDHGSSHPSDDAADGSLESFVFMPTLTRIDAAFHSSANKQGAGSLRSYHHLGA